MTRTVRLLSISVHNFKGIRTFAQEFPEGIDVFSIHGDNATGKTSLHDAYLWCLFGRSSDGRATFEVLHLRNGKQEPEAEVTVRLSVDGAPIEFRRAYKSKTKTRRGSIEVEADGYTTDYWVGPVPHKQKDFDAAVRATLGPPETVHLLSDAFRFNEGIKWEERRRILVSMGGSVTVEDVIASDESLKDLPSVLAGQKPEDVRKILTEQRKAINAEADGINPRIDELTRTVEGLADTRPREELITARSAAEAALATARQELADLRAGGGSAALRSDLAAAEADLKRHDEGVLDSLRSAVTAAADAQAEAARAVASGEHASKLRRDAESKARLAAAGIEAEVAQLRVSYNERAAEKAPDPDVEGVCAGCGRPLPEAAVAAAKARTVEAWNAERASDLTRIMKAAQEKQAEQARLQGVAAAATTDAVEIEGKLEADRAVLKTADEALAAARAALAAGVPQTPGRMLKVMEVSNVRGKLEGLDVTALEEPILTRVATAQLELDTLARELATVEQRKASQDRIEALEKRGRELASETERIQHAQWLLDELTRREADMLTDRINELLSLAKVKLFDDYQSGGVKEMCVVTVNDVSYPDLNHGTKTNVGLDVLNALQRHFGLIMPVWVDNAESVTRLISTPAQVIRLVVDAEAQALTPTNA